MECVRVKKQERTCWFSSLQSTAEGAAAASQQCEVSLPLTLRVVWSPRVGRPSMVMCPHSPAGPSAAPAMATAAPQLFGEKLCSCAL